MGILTPQVAKAPHQSIVFWHRSERVRKEVSYFTGHDEFLIQSVVAVLRNYRPE